MEGDKKHSVMDVASEFYEGTYRTSHTSLLLHANFFCMKIEKQGGVSAIQDHFLNLQAGKHRNSENGDRGLSTNPVLILNISIIA